LIYLREIVEFCKADALAYRLMPSEVSDYRYFCREYSKMFHTPLHIVFTLPPENVILAYFEEEFEKKNLSIDDDFDSVVEEVRRIEDPEYDATQEKEFSEFVEGIELFEEGRLARGDGIPNPRKKKVNAPPEATLDDEPNPDLPKQGSIDMSRFNQDEES
jgi:hypothetical protein